MIWIILVILLVAGVWQWKSSTRPANFGSLREEMDALRCEIARQRDHPQ